MTDLEVNMRGGRRGSGHQSITPVSIVKDGTDKGPQLASDKLHTSDSDHSLQNAFTPLEDHHPDDFHPSEEVTGPSGQLCASQRVLEEVLSRYTHIHTNVFRGGATSKIKSEFMPCDCQFNHLADEVWMACGVGSHCINRELSIECPVDRCPTGTFCQNYIDATKKGNCSRFMNHSCRPNCELQKWVVGNQMRIGIFAKLDIAEMEELTFDYKFERLKAQICHCGEDVCTGYIGSDKPGDSAILSVEHLDGLSDDDDEPMDSRKKRSSDDGRLKTIDQVKEIVRSLMLNRSDSTKVLQILNKLLKTDISLLKKFIHFRGVLFLEQCLEEYLHAKSIIRYSILKVLDVLPISTKNSIVSLEKLLESLTNKDEFGEETAQLAKDILQAWSGLEMVYRIPKRAAEDSQVGQDAKRVNQRLEYFEEFQPASTRSLEFRGIEIEDTVSPAISWNLAGAVPQRVTEIKTESMEISISSTNISEYAVEQLIRNAQEVTKLAAEESLKKQLEEKELEKKLKKQTKQAHKKRKEKMREILASTPKETLDKKFEDLPTEIRHDLKSNISKVVIKVMSRYQSQMEPDEFKDLAKIITKGLISKELKKRDEVRGGELSEKTRAAIKSYVKEYLGRHGVVMEDRE